MKNKFVGIFCLAVCLLSYPLQAQMKEMVTDRSPKVRLHRIGATLGFGVADMNMNTLNTRLQALDIDQFYDQLAVYNVSIYAGFREGIGISMDISGGSSLGGKDEYSPDANVNFNTFTFGPTLYYSLLTTNRIHLMALGGMRINDMSFKYNADSYASTDFDALLTAPSASSNHVVAIRTAFPAESAIFGARLQYRLGKKENLKPREYSLGIDTGYNYGFETVPWSEPLSRQIIRDMPAIKTDHFYMNFTFSAYLLR